MSPAPGWVPADADERTATLLPDLQRSGWALPAALSRPGRRSWLCLGTVGGASRASVDPAGLVTPRPGARGWSLDWWVGAEDRWHLPGREANVVQERLADAPVAQTRVRVPGGVVLQRAWSVRAPAGEPAGELVVVEVSNETKTPIAVALVLRPLDPTGVGHIGRVVVTAVPGSLGNARLVTVDGQAALLLPRPPGRWALGTGGADLVDVVTGGDAQVGEPPLGEPLVDEAGLATVALVLPVPHATSLRVVLPRDLRDEARAATMGWPSVLPGADVVASGWTAQADRGARLDLPDPRLAAAAAAARRALLLAPVLRGPSQVGPGDPAVTGLSAGRGDGPATPAEAALLAGALCRIGRDDEVEPAMVALAERWHTGGATDPDPALRGPEVVAMATHAALSGRTRVLEAVLSSAAALVQRWERDARKGRLTDRPAARRGAQAAAAALADALDVAGQPDAAADLRGAADRLGPVPATAVDLGAEQVGLRAVGRAAREGIAAGDPAALDLLGLLLRAGSTTWTWPSVLDRTTGSGAPEGEGDDRVVAALVLDALRDLLLVERADGIDLAPLVPTDWLGLGWEAHEVPTRFGRLSYAVRWHGDRPALLWELAADAWVGDRPVVLRAPGLDPTWSSTEGKGEALLAAIAPPAPVEGDEPRPERRARTVAPRSVWATLEERPADPAAGAESPSPPPIDEGGFT